MCRECDRDYNRRLVRRVALWAAIIGGLALWTHNNAAAEELTREEMGYEIAWQALHAVDVMQTLNSVAKEPACYRESNPVTRAMIGEHPDAGTVIAWGIASAGLHALMTHKLADWDAPMWLRRGWAYVHLTEKGITVTSNAGKGIRPFGRNDYHWDRDSNTCMY